MARFSIRITGIVQGVGFRPFIYKLACELALAGWVQNDTQGVLLEVEGDVALIDRFLERLRQEAPAAAVIESVSCRELAPTGETAFAILPSQEGMKNTLISPDLAVCADCLQELHDPRDFRYRYPFINCTNCGPRFTIIADLPYDRAKTTMRDFALCETCRSQYQDPHNRRFHAQPLACAACGPQLFFSGQEQGQPLEAAQQALRQGKIVAVKGLGGYHLLCDATAEQAVQRLRERKYRDDKPFALMMANMETVRRYCRVSAAEETLLTSPRAPIVLLEKTGLPLAGAIAPGQRRLGVMLPYTPLHHLLLEDLAVLVATSGNLADEPIVYDDQLAQTQLAPLADAFLWHNRPIWRRCDDSVAVVAAGQTRLLRRARGYVPQPIMLKDNQQTVLAVGGEQKNTFCLAVGERAFLSQHIGDLENPATLDSFTKEIAYFQQMFNGQAQVMAHDLHPEYLSTKYAQQSDLPLVPVQHHHAHLASVLAEHQLDEPVLGVIFDGSGYGTDGKLWGSEFLVGDCCSYQRLAHLDYALMPGGLQAIRQPWRMALSYLITALGPDHPLVSRFPNQWPQVWQAAAAGVNAPATCGMGRLFDAVAALIGVRQQVTYEGQAACELEQIVEPEAGFYEFAYHDDLIDWRPLIVALAADIMAQIEPGILAARFHNSLVELVRHQVRRSGLNTVALSGGVWQNVYLLERTVAALTNDGVRVLSNAQVPANDGGLALGQAAIAARFLQGETRCV